MPAPAPRPGGSAFLRRSHRAGFTLLEILIVIALIAMVTTMLVVGTARLLRDKPATADEIFWKTVGDVRKSALLENRDIRLSFDPKTKEFVAGTGDQAQRFPFDPRAAGGEVGFDFLAPSSASGSSSILIAGHLVDTQTIPFVTFYGDGTCSPFRAQLKSGVLATLLEIDPWTCAPILRAQPSS